MNTQKDLCGTVLYVDQEETASKYIRERFSNEFKLLVATSALQALTFLCDRSLHIDVVVSDDKLPDQASAGILRHAIEIHPYIQCILLTADGLPDAVAQQAGLTRGWRVFEKPIELDTLSAAIEEAVMRSMRQQMRCHRFEAIGDTLRFLGEQISAQNAAIQRLFEHVTEQCDQGVTDLRLIREETAVVSSGMSRLQGELLQSLNHALHEIGYARDEDTHISAGRLVRDTLLNMSLSQAERDTITIVVKQDFPIPRTAALMDLVLSNIFRFALASAKGATGKPWMTVTVQVQGAPEIVIADSGEGVAADVRRELTEALRTAPLSPQVQILKTCMAVMRFLGGTVLLTSYPVNTSQLTLEFPPPDDGMNSSGERLKPTEFSS